MSVSFKTYPIVDNVPTAAAVPSALEVDHSK